MGTFKVTVALSPMTPEGRGVRIPAEGDPSVEVEMIAGTRAMFSTVPACILSELGVVPCGKRRFRVRSGEEKVLEEGRVWVAIGDAWGPTVVGFDDDDASAVLGSHTLTGLFLDVDTDAERIVPARLVMTQRPTLVPHSSPRY